jgi:hypothetical protein
VILGESEVSVARMFAEAGEVYRLHPTALHLRGMNMLYETMRSGGANVIMVPSSALDSMNLGMIGGLTSLARVTGDDTGGLEPPADGQGGPGGAGGRPVPPTAPAPPADPGAVQPFGSGLPSSMNPFNLPGGNPFSGNP